MVSNVRNPQRFSSSVVPNTSKPLWGTWRHMHTSQTLPAHPFLMWQLSIQVQITLSPPLHNKSKLHAPFGCPVPQASFCKVKSTIYCSAGVFPNHWTRVKRSYRCCCWIPIHLCIRRQRGFRVRSPDPSARAMFCSAVRLRNTSQRYSKPVLSPMALIKLTGFQRIQSPGFNFFARLKCRPKLE